MKPQKWLLSFGFLALAITAFVIFRDALQMQNERLHHFDQAVSSDLKTIAATIEKESGQAVNLAHFLSLTQREGFFGKRESTHDFCGKMLECSPSVNAFFVAYKPNADNQDAIFASKDNGPIYVGPYGQFASLWERDAESPGRVKASNYWARSVAKQVAKFQTQMLEQNMPLQIVTDSQHNERSYMVTRFMLPIMIQNTDVGMSGVELRIDHFYKELKKLKKYQGLDFFIINQDQRIVISSLHKTFDLVHINDLYLDKSGKPIKNIYKNKDGYRELKKNQDIPLPTSKESRALSLLLSRYFGKSTTKQKESQNYVQSLNPQQSLWVASIALTTMGWHIIAYAPTQAVKGRLFEGMIQRSIISLSILIFTFSLFVLSVQRAHVQETKLIETLNSLESGNLDPAQFNPERFSGSYIPIVHKIKNFLTKLTETIASLKTIGLGISGKATQASFHFNQCMSAQQIALKIINKEVNSANTCNDQFSSLMKLFESSKNHGDEATSEIEKSLQTLRKFEIELIELGKASDMFSSRLDLINDKSQSIYKIVNLFSSITEKTSLLSFNASIEAEKTEGHTSEIVPISEKLRRLSKQIEDTNKEIEVDIRELHTSVFSGVVELDKFYEAVQVLVKILLDSLYDLERILMEIKNFISRTNELGREIEKQARSLDELAFQMGTLARESDQYLTLTQENLLGMKELERESEKLIHRLLEIRD